MTSRRRYQREKRPRTVTKTVQNRAGLVFLIILGLMVFLLGVIIYIGRFKGSDYNKKILTQMDYNNSTIEAERGKILDRNGTCLAYNVNYYNLTVEPKNILLDEDQNDLKATVTAITECFTDLDYDTVVEKILANKNSYYLLLESNITEEEYNTYTYCAAEYMKRKTIADTEAYNKANNTNKEADTSDYDADAENATVTVPESAGLEGDITGVRFITKAKRYYPNNSFASNVIGFSNNSGGVSGLEKSYDDILSGTDGRTYGYLNDNSSVDVQTVDAVDGYTIVTTIDSYIQKVCESALKSYEKKTGSKVSAIMVMDPDTAEVLAMATSNTYNLNTDREATAEDVYDKYDLCTQEEYEAMSEEEQQELLSEAAILKWRNFCVSDSYEPGSVAKSFTVAAALEEGTAKASSTYYCNGSQTYGNSTIHCHLRSGHGTVTLAGALMASCNDALMQIGVKLGAEKFAKYQQMFGIGQLTGIDLPNELSCSEQYYTADNMDTVTLATNSFGQNFYLTMVQMCAGYCSLVNGGYYYQPHVVKQILNSDGDVVENIEPVLVRQTVSHSTSEFIKDALYQTVEKGTGEAVKIEGYEIGGKTGTAEKNDQGSSKKELYTISFMATAPAYDPEVIVYVVVDEPNCSKSENSVQAKPIVKKVLKKILPYLNIYPSSDDDTDDSNGDFTSSKYDENDNGGDTVSASELRENAENALEDYNGDSND